jgi:putative NIF3 family GTP cyclohydrolase 1 type 2
MLRNRLKLLFDADIALAAYHLPLDAHPKLGNNALIAEGLAAERIEPFGRHRDRTLGFLADLPGEGLPLAELVDRVRKLTGREPLVQGPDDPGDPGDPGNPGDPDDPGNPGSPAVINSLAIVSGGASEYLEEAAAAGADGLLTGEAKEKAMASAKELGLVLIAAGHYATETFGVKALGEHLAERFDLEHVFIDIPNPV